MATWDERLARAMAVVDDVLQSGRWFGPAPHMERSLTSRRLLRSWLQGSTGWTAFAAGWTLFAVAFAASQLFRPQPSATQAAIAALQVAAPAALLGLAVVRLGRMFAPGQMHPAVWLSVHAVIALAYPPAWMACVSGINSVRHALRTGEWRVFRPPEHVVHWHALAGILIVATLLAVTWSFGHWWRAEDARRRTEMKLLRAQLNPHFLANGLHALFALTRRDPAAAERGLERFTALLRDALRVGRDDVEQVSLEAEWSFTHNYLEVQRLCHGERLRVHSDLDDDALDCRVPALILQPIVENAVVHAVAARAQGATISIVASYAGKELVLRVADDGPGCDRGRVLASTGLGLRSVRARLAYLHGRAAHVDVECHAGGGFDVTLRIPQTTPAPRQGAA